MSACLVPGCYQPASYAAFYDVTLCPDHTSDLYAGAPSGGKPLGDWRIGAFEEVQAAATLCGEEPEGCPGEWIAAALKRLAQAARGHDHTTPPQHPGPLHARGGRRDCAAVVARGARRGREGMTAVIERPPQCADSYAAFLYRKSQMESRDGFAPTFLPDCLFDFQAALTEWAVLGGRKALMEDCGLGKTLQELVWAQNVLEHTGKPVLILTPLGVAGQTVREGEKFGIECHRLRDGMTPRGIVVLNYERLHKVEPADFGGVVCDESSILKSFEGSTRSLVTRFMAKIPYRLLATATAAPNDYVELGTSSEALGYLGFMDMLNRFFVNNRNNSALRGFGAESQWRFKGHAERPFWRWMCSWARSLRSPADLGFDDAAFRLPPLREIEHRVKPLRPPAGMLFDPGAVNMAEEREERRRTLTERCELAASLINAHAEPAVAWCHLNDEGDLLERLIPSAIQVSGRDADEAKEEKLDAFTSGAARVLVTKPVVAGFGLNLQHCAYMTSFVSHSFEQHYQCIRRCWRFGQTRPVEVHHVVSDGEGRIIGNLRRKAALAERMFSEMSAHMRDELTIARTRDYEQTEELPAWLSQTS